MRRHRQIRGVGGGAGRPRRRFGRRAVGCAALVAAVTVASLVPAGGPAVAQAPRATPPAGDDVLWYSPGPGRDTLWVSSGSGFSSWPVTVGGHYLPIVGSFNSHPGSDILWYGRGSDPDALWVTSESGYRSVPIRISGVYVPVVGDFSGDGLDDIIWYAPGAVADALWTAVGDGTFRTSPLRLSGTYHAVPLDADGDGRTDVLWYAPGAASDALWLSDGDGTFTAVPSSVNGTFTPVVVDANLDGSDDVIWYGPGRAPDVMWLAVGRGRFTNRPVAISGSYSPVALDHNGDGALDVLWHAQGSTPDHVWVGTSSGRFVSREVRLDATRSVPVILDSNADGRDDVLVYGPGSAPDVLWRSTTQGFSPARVTVSGLYRPLVVDANGSRARRLRPYVAWPAQALAGFPRMSGVELRNLWNAVEPLPGTARIATPAITGHGAADERIRRLAESRGYRPRAVATGGLVPYGSVTLQRPAASSMTSMSAAARAAGRRWTVSYGFRSIDHQRRIFLSRIPYSAAQIAAGRADGVILATLRWVAAPGYSKHHSGYVVDMRDSGGGSFGSSPSARWLEAGNYANAKRFGWIPSYPAGAGAQGPDPEPWEYAWVGVDRIRCAGWVTAVADPSAYWYCPAGR